jgi:hypothetical protein
VSQVTLYLDEETAERMRKAAQRDGVSQGQWGAGLIRERIRTDWPSEVRASAAGAVLVSHNAQELRRVPDLQRVDRF